MFLKREIPWIIRIFMLIILIFTAFVYFGFLAFVEWFLGRVRR